MPKCFIKIGEMKNTLFLPSFTTFAQIILLVIDAIYPEVIKNHILESTSIGQGELAIIIMPYLKCFSESNTKKKIKSECSKKN